MINTERIGSPRLNLEWSRDRRRRRQRQPQSPSLDDGKSGAPIKRRGTRDNDAARPPLVGAPRRPPVQSLSVFIFGITFGAVDGRVVRMGRPGRQHARRLGRPRDAGRLLAGRAARRGVILAGHRSHHGGDALRHARRARRRLDDGVFTSPPG